MIAQQPFTVLINRQDDYKAQRRQILLTAPILVVGLVGVLCLVSGASWKGENTPTELYLGSAEETKDGEAIKAAEGVDENSVKIGMPEENVAHNPNGEEFKQAVAEQESEMETNKGFLKGTATDAKSKKVASRHQTLKDSVTAHHTVAKTTQTKSGTEVSAASGPAGVTVH